MLPPYTLATRLIIPAIGLDSPVVGIPPGETSVPDDAVGWLWGPPGVGFNCVLAGHRDKRCAVFLRLNELKLGDEVMVQDRDGKWYT